MTVRVIRTMEYTYPSLEKAEQDMARWMVPATGVKAFGPGQLIRSTYLLAPVAVGPDECPTDYRKSFNSRAMALNFITNSELSTDEVEAYYCDCKKWHVRPIKGV